MNQSKLNQISPHIYWLSPDETTDRPILGAISGEQGTLLVDAGNSPAHANLFLDELSTANVGPPTFLALTHWHWDHVFGAAALNLPTFAHVETKRVVQEMAHLDWSDEALDRRVAAGTEIEFCRDMMKAELPDRTHLQIRPPEISFTGQIELDLGGVTAQIIHVGGDHAADSSIVYVPADKVIFLSDCLYVDLYHGPPNYTTRQLFPLIDRLLSYDAEFYLWGHSPEPMSKAELVDYTTLLKTIGQLVEQLGDNREAILSTLTDLVNSPLTEEHTETADAFLAGLKKISNSILPTPNLPTI